jgi:hypothetical protein
MAATNACESWSAWAAGRLAAADGYPTAFLMMSVVSLCSLSLMRGFAAGAADRTGAPPRDVSDVGRAAARVGGGCGWYDARRETPMLQSSTLLRSLRNSWNEIVAVLPDVILAVALLLVGWLVARFLRRQSVRVLRRLRVDELAERSGFDDYLVRGGVDLTAVTLIAGTIYWLVLASVFLILLDALGLPAADVLLGRLGAFIPNLVVAVGILVFGTLLARIAGGLVFGYLSNIGSPAAAVIGAVTRYALLMFVLFMAAEQLAIRSEVLVSGFQIAFAAVCLAAALAFGLGGRDWAAQVIARYTRK